MGEYYEPENDIQKINKKIHTWEPDNTYEFTVYDYGEYNVKYNKEHIKKDTGSYMQADELRVYKNNELIKTHRPHLDPYVSYDKNIITLSSDGEIWVYDLDANKELTYKQGIVAFYQSTYKTDLEYTIVNNERVITSENWIMIEGDGCPWGCESCDVGFKLILDHDLNVVDYNEEWDEWDDEEETEENEDEREKE